VLTLINIKSLRCGTTDIDECANYKFEAVKKIIYKCIAASKILIFVVLLA
jgi:hypothetical protein